MKQAARTFPFMIAIILAGLSCTHADDAPNAKATTTAKSSGNRVVVMISLDGLGGYYLDDPKCQMPTLRELAKEGARATGMKASTPTVTWPNHTTLVTGVNPARHGVVGNNYLDRATGKQVTLISDPVYDKPQIVKVPTLYDIAKAAGMKTAAIRWPATRNAPTLDWTVPDVLTIALLQKYSTPSLLEECTKAGIPLDTAAQESDPPESTDPNAPAPTTTHIPRDLTYTNATKLILREHKPSLMLLHLAEVDHIEHLFGPKSPKAYAAIKDADGYVREVWDEMKRDFPGRATLFVVSDHGFSSIERMLYPNVLLRKAGLIDVKGIRQAAGDVRLCFQGGVAFVYLTADDDAKRNALVERVTRTFEGVEGYGKVVPPSGLAEYGVADPKVDPHAPDMLIFANEGNVFGDTAAGELAFRDKPERKGSHGHDPNLPDLHATFIAWGAGIKRGANVGEINNTDVAPTIAKLLGLDLPNPDGKVIEGALVR